MIEILFLFNLTSEIVSTVYWFLKFIKSDNLFVKKISQNCLNFFDFITSHYLKFSSSQESLQFNSSIKWRECSASSDSLSSFWTVEEKSKLKTDQAQFLHLTQSLASHSAYTDWLANQRSQIFETIHFFSLQSECFSTFNMASNSDKLDLWIVNLEKIWNIKLDARFDAFMIMMSRNQQNSSSFSQIEISLDEFTTFSQTFKLKKIRFFDLKLNISLNKKNTIFLKKKIWIQNVFVFIQ